jgi:hypothetical protein
MLNAGPKALPYADPDFAPYINSQNLLGPDAGPEQVGSTSPHSYQGFGTGTSGMPIADLGLAAGDVISGGFLVSTDGDGTSPADVRLRISFWDSTGTQIGSNHDGDFFGTGSPSGPGPGTSKVTNLTIPANTVYMGYSIRRSGDETWHVTNARLNAGPKVLPFTEPPVRYQRYESPARLDPGACVIDDGTSTNTSGVGGVEVSSSSPSGSYPDRTIWTVV